MSNIEEFTPQYSQKLLHQFEDLGNIRMKKDITHPSYKTSLPDASTNNKHQMLRTIRTQNTPAI
jgi:hypothetical protein